MKLVLDLDGVLFEFEITNYVGGFSLIPSIRDFANVSLSLNSDYINYELKQEPLLMSKEVEYLKYEIKNLLEDKTTNEKEIYFENPVLGFLLEPSGDVISNDDNTGYIECECSSELIINIKNSNRLSSNEFRLYMVKEELEAFYWYLRVVTDEISINDLEVKDYIDKGIFV